MEKQFTPQQALDAFIRLVRIPSVTGKELPAVEYLEGLLDGFGIEYTRIAKTPERPNLLAKLPAEAPCLPPVVLISHIDVVPGDEAQWRHPVFGGEVHGGRIYGRGTLDTKQLTMMELYAFLALRGTRRNRDVYFLATADEEAGSAFGMEYVKQQRPGLFQNAVVLNEGGGFPLRIDGQEYMTLTIGEKAVCKLRLWAGGQGGHASSPGGNQAIQTLARGIEKVYAAEGEMLFGSRGVQEAMEKVLGTTQVDSPVGAQIYAYAGQNSLAMRDYKIGERSNVLPALAETQLECRVLPGAGAEEVLAFVRARLAGTGVECELVEYQPGFACDFDGPECRLVVRLLEKACRDAGFACRVLPMLALGRTDGRFFGSEGSRVYGCSPVLGADSFDETLPKVHGKDESIAEASFFFGCRVVRSMVLAACTLGGQP